MDKDLKAFYVYVIVTSCKKAEVQADTCPRKLTPYATNNPGTIFGWELTNHAGWCFYHFYN